MNKNKIQKFDVYINLRVAVAEHQNIYQCQKFREKTYFPNENYPNSIKKNTCRSTKYFYL